MSPAFWTSLILVLTSGRPEEYHLRHEWKRPHAGRRFPETRGHPSPRLPENAALPLRKISRPLFSWDTPVEGPPPVSPQPPREWKPFIDQNARARVSGRASVAFRNSYVHKTDPSADATPGPVPSKKIFRIVYGNSKREGWDGVGQRVRKKGKCSGNNSEACLGTGRNGVRRLSKGRTGNRQRLRGDSKRKRKKTACSAMNGTCDHICVEENGRATCLCYPGFHLVGGSACVDVDECRENNGGCQVTCINTPGSRRCACPVGFRLSPAGDRCLDVNECLLRNGHGPCQDKCTNTDGGYFCGCDGLEGTLLSADNHTCEKVRDCGPGSAGCSHSCVVTLGKAFCTCPDGYELGDDWKTCHAEQRKRETGNRARI